MATHSTRGDQQGNDARQILQNQQLYFRCRQKLLHTFVLPGGKYVQPVLDAQCSGAKAQQQVMLVARQQNVMLDGWPCPNRAKNSAYLSRLLNEIAVPFFSSMSKSKVLPVVLPRAKFTHAISSKRTCTGGLCTKMNPLSRGQRRPLPALCEQVIELVPECL